MRKHGAVPGLTERECLRRIQEILWGPDCTEPDREWSSDELDLIAEELQAAGYGPKEERHDV